MPYNNPRYNINKSDNVTELVRDLAGTEYVSGVSSHKLGLNLIISKMFEMKMLKQGDLVLHPIKTYQSTLATLCNNGLNVSYLDTVKNTFAMDVKAVEDAKAIFVPMVYGNFPDIDRLKELNIPLILTDGYFGGMWDNANIFKYADFACIDFKYINENLTQAAVIGKHQIVQNEIMGDKWLFKMLPDINDKRKKTFQRLQKLFGKYWKKFETPMRVSDKADPIWQRYPLYCKDINVYWEFRLWLEACKMNVTADVTQYANLRENCPNAQRERGILEIPIPLFETPIDEDIFIHLLENFLV